jgi:hypothetical protein
VTVAEVDPVEVGVEDPGLEELDVEFDWRQPDTPKMKLEQIQNSTRLRTVLHFMGCLWPLQPRSNQERMKVL